ncbi:MAG: hypothetical protein LBU18_06725 [Treponema sp.]|nr:hypothetical protein [Treponema sp.]
MEGLLRLDLRYKAFGKKDWETTTTWSIRNGLALNEDDGKGGQGGDIQVVFGDPPVSSMVGVESSTIPYEFNNY